MSETNIPLLNHYVAVQNGKFSTRKVNGEDLYYGDNLKRIFDSEINKPENKERPLVLFFHGGLVNEKGGVEAAEKLKDEFYDAGGYPIFYGWQSGFGETFFRNIPEYFLEQFTGSDGIGKTKLFKILTKKLKRFVVSKVKDVVTSGTKGAGNIELVDPVPSEVEREIDEMEAKSLNFDSDEMVLTRRQEEQLEQLFSDDRKLKAELMGMLTESIGEDGEGKAKGENFEPVESWISASVMEELKKDVEVIESGEKGPFAFAKIIKHLVQIGVAVIGRYSKGTDHGLRVTITEEILRKLYIDDIGAEFWGAMKKDTADAFKPNAEKYAGTAILKLIKEARANGDKRKIILAGHSTGAVYICNFLKNADVNELDADAKFDVIFLAAACKFSLFANTLENHQDRIRSIRNFGMKDAVEQADKLVPVLYTASLLYLVSGLLEKNEDGDLIVDAPIVGMQRYYEDRKPYNNDSAVQKGKAFLDNKNVWSVVTGTDGWESESKKHVDFDDDPLTRKSVGEIITSIANQ